MGQLQEGLRADELVTALPAVLSAAEDAAFRWLNDFPPTTLPPPQPPRPKVSGSAVRERDAPSDPLIEELRSFLDEHYGERVVVDWGVEE